MAEQQQHRRIDEEPHPRVVNHQHQRCFDRDSPRPVHVTECKTLPERLAVEDPCEPNVVRDAAVTEREDMQGDASRAHKYQAYPPLVARALGHHLAYPARPVSCIEALSHPSSNTA